MGALPGEPSEGGEGLTVSMAGAQGDRFSGGLKDFGFYFE